MPITPDHEGLRRLRVNGKDRYDRDTDAIRLQLATALELAGQLVAIFERLGAGEVQLGRESSRHSRRVAALLKTAQVLESCAERDAWMLVQLDAVDENAADAAGGSNEPEAVPDEGGRHPTPRRGSEGVPFPFAPQRLTCWTPPARLREPNRVRFCRPRFVSRCAVTGPP